MLPAHKILVIDDNTDNGVLLVRSLARKFPKSVVQLCRDGETALAVFGAEPIQAVVTHLSAEAEAISFIQAVRQLSSTIPILAVSSVDRRAQFVAADANAFLNYDEWLRVGSVVAGLLPKGPTPT